MLWRLLFISLTAFCNATEISELKGTSSQSSTYSDNSLQLSSGRAMDENLNTCAHTLQLHNWWRIDLLGVCTISSISIYNIEHHYSDINGAQIYIGNSLENCTTNPMMCQNITNFKKGEWNNFTFNTNVSGRYITVFSPENNYLILCEVKILGTIKESPFELIRENKTWEDALYHCRDQNMDLASIVNAETQTWAELEAQEASSQFVWLGLHYTCTLDFWFWIDDQRLKFERWAQKSMLECDMSGAMENQGDHLWFSKHDSNKFNFICAK